MLFLSLFDYSDVSYEELRAVLPKEERKRLLHGKSDSYRRASGAGRALLFSLFEATMGTKAPTVFTTKLGAPHFVTSRVRFSISHDDTTVAVALSPSGREVGVDIQGFASLDRYEPSRLTALRERYSLVEPSGENPKVRLLRAKLHDGHFTFEPEQPVAPIDDPRLSFLASFTYTEALLKAHGTGFASRSEAPSLKEAYESGTLVIRDDGDGLHVLSYCLKK